MKRSIGRKAGAAATAALMVWWLFALLFSAVPAQAETTCTGAKPVLATYYKNVAGVWVKVAEQCESGPAGGSFSRDYTGAPPKDGDTELAEYRVVYSGLIGVAQAGWHGFSLTAGGTLGLAIAGVPVENGRYFDLAAAEADNNFSITFTKLAAQTGTFAVTWAPVNCAADGLKAVYTDPAGPARKALVVRCESAIGDSPLQRDGASLPSGLPAQFRAVYTGKLDVARADLYQFTPSVLPAGDALEVSIDGTAVLPPPDPAQPFGLADLKQHNNPVVITYTKGSAGAAAFTLAWERFTCPVGEYLGVYYDTPALSGPIRLAQCEPRPSGVTVAAGQSARFKARLYLEKAGHTFTASSGVTVKLDGAAPPATPAEGMHELMVEAAAPTEPVTVSVDISRAGVTLPRCPEGKFVQTLSTGERETCVAMPTAGPASGTATYSGWFYIPDGTYAFEPAGSVSVNGAPVTGAIPLTGGMQVLAITASAPGAMPVKWNATACPDGLWLGEYFAGEIDSALAQALCEARPAYGAGAKPPLGTTAHAARWSANLGLLDGGLYRFQTGAGLTVKVDGTALSLSTGSAAPEGARDLMPGMHQLALERPVAAVTAGASLDWAGPEEEAGVVCPDGLYLAEYYHGDFSGKPYLTACERAPYLSHARSWMGTAAANAAVRWTGMIPLAAGEYTFATGVGGEATVWLDGTRLYTGTETEDAQVLTGSRTVVRGLHEVKVEWRSCAADGGGGCTEAKFPFVRFSQAATPAAPASKADCTGSFFVQWYNNPTLSGTPVATECAGLPDEHWGSLPPHPAVTSGSYSARWTGDVSLPAGRYRLSAASSAGMKVMIGSEFPFVEYNECFAGSSRPVEFWHDWYQSADAEVEFSGTQTITLEFSNAPSGTTVPAGANTCPVPPPLDTGGDSGESAPPNWSSSAFRVRLERASSPVVTGARFSSASQVTLTYGEPLDTGVIPHGNAFTVTDLDGHANAVTSLAVLSSTVTLNLASPVPDGGQVVIRYSGSPVAGGSDRAFPVLGAPVFLGDPANLAQGLPLQAAGAGTWLLDLGDIYALTELRVEPVTATVQTSADGIAYAAGLTNPRRARYIRVSGTAELPVIEAWGGRAGFPAEMPQPLAGTGPTNVALGKSASLSPDPGVADRGASAGVNGVLNRTFEDNSLHWDYFLTGADTAPYWQVDLGGLYYLSRVRIFNRADADFDNARHLKLLVAETAGIFTAVAEQLDPFGGDGAPYALLDAGGRRARYVRIQAVNTTAQPLHLAEVEVYGVTAVDSLIVSNQSGKPALVTNRPAIEVIDDLITLHYDRQLNQAYIPPIGSFTVTVDGVAAAVTNVQIAGRDVILYIAKRTDATERVIVSYAGTQLQDLSGNAAALLTAKQASHLAYTPLNIAEGKSASMDVGLKPAPLGGATTAGAGAGVDADITTTFSIGGAEPWWIVDLADTYALTRIRVFNTASLADQAKAANLRVEASVDGTTWNLVFDNKQLRSSAIFGNEGAFLAFDLAYDNARFVRLSLPGTGRLNLAEVQIYGVPALGQRNLALGEVATGYSSAGTISEWGAFLLRYDPADPSHPADPFQLTTGHPSPGNDGKSATTAVLPAAATADSGCACKAGWQVDMRRAQVVNKVVVRFPSVAQLNTFLGATGTYVELSETGTGNWEALYAPGDKALTAGPELILQVPSSLGRYVRIRSTALPQLDLEEVSVFGFTPEERAAQDPLPNLAFRRPATLLSAKAPAGLAQWQDRYLSGTPSGTGARYDNPALAVDGIAQAGADALTLPALGSLNPDCNCKLYWAVDLQHPYQLTKLVLRFPDADAAGAFKSGGQVQFRSGETWTTLAASALGTPVAGAGGSYLLVVPLPGPGATLSDGAAVPAPGKGVDIVRLSSATLSELKLIEVEVYGYPE